MMENSTAQVPFQFPPPHVWYPDLYPDKGASMLATYFLLCSFGIPGNVVTIWVLNSTEALRKKPINVLLIHQAIIDAFVCAATIVEEIVDTSKAASGIPFVCHFILAKSLSSGCMVLSAYNMALLSMERYSAIVHPMQYDPEAVKKVGTEIELLANLSTLQRVLWADFFDINPFIGKLTDGPYMKKGYFRIMKA